MSNVNENIRKFRKFRGMSQKTLGQKVHKSTNVVSNWENGLHSPDLDTIAEVCKVLEVTPNQIFGWEENPEYARIMAYYNRMSELQKEMASLKKKIGNIEIPQDAKNIISLEIPLDSDEEK